MEPIKIGDGTIERDWGISVVAPGKHAMWFHESGQKQQLSAKNCKAPTHQVAATIGWHVVPFGGLCLLLQVNLLP